jgi:hypothetical protein
MSRAPSFDEVTAMDGEERRNWLRAWMERHGHATANAAAPDLALSRQSVERMLYEGSRERVAVGNQTMMIAWLRDRLRSEARRARKTVDRNASGRQGKAAAPLPSNDRSIDRN